MRFGVWEIILIIVWVLIIFGGSKLSGVGKSLGKGIREFKEEVHADDGAEQKEEAKNGTEEKDGEDKA